MTVLECMATILLPLLRVMRDLDKNPLDAACCGAGDAIEIIPSAAQMNRDMPIVHNGKQIWPKP
jgi:hypothetical protein